MAARKTSRTRSSSLRSRSIGCLFWLCLLAIIVAVGYVARVQIRDAFGRLTGGSPSTSRQAPPQVTVKPLPPADAAGGSQPAAGQTTQTPAKPPAPADRSVTVTRPGPSGQTSSAQTGEKPLRKTRLFFLSVDPNGTILMKSVIRPIPQSDSPLRDALQTLLKGPTSQEINLGLLTMIPAGTALRGVIVRGDIAYVDFSESFRFNSLGIDGMKAQLRQVVYAATEFQTVKKVQFLIEGKKVDYLGTEGVRINEPLSRSSF